jgi:hypothetical protein
VTEFTHANFVAAMSGLISALPIKERINPSDPFIRQTHSPTAIIFVRHWSPLYRVEGILVSRSPPMKEPRNGAGQTLNEYILAILGYGF